MVSKNILKMFIQ